MLKVSKIIWLDDLAISLWDSRQCCNDACSVHKFEAIVANNSSIWPYPHMKSEISIILWANFCPLDANGMSLC